MGTDADDCIVDAICPDLRPVDCAVVLGDIDAFARERDVGAVRCCPDVDEVAVGIGREIRPVIRIAVEEARLVDRQAHGARNRIGAIACCRLDVGGVICIRVCDIAHSILDDLCCLEARVGEDHDDCDADNDEGDEEGKREDVTAPLCWAPHMPVIGTGAARTRCRTCLLEAGCAPRRCGIAAAGAPRSSAPGRRGAACRRRAGASVRAGRVGASS